MLRVPLVQPIVRPLDRGLLEPAGGSLNAAIRAMFGTSKGVMYDLTDKSKLYQDSARTTLVSANGDPIGSVTDLSPNLKHASQATAASRPLFQGYADLDGVDDSWATAAIDFTGTDAVTVVVGVHKAGDTAIGVVAELGTSFGASSFSLFAPLSTSNKDFAFGSRGGGLSGVSSSGTIAGPVTAVVTGIGDISSDTAILRVNGAQVATAADDQGAGNYSNAALNIGRRNNSTLPFNGRIYRMIVIGRALTAAELALAERWAGQPAGIVL